MNYEKKRKRQNGRQKLKESTYSIWIDESAKIHATLDNPLKKTSKDFVPTASCAI